MNLKKPLAVETICLDLKGTTKEKILSEMVDLLMASGHIRDRDAVLKAVMEREKRMSTGMQNGIAIPHVRNPLVLQVEKPTICACFFEKPLNFGALDGLPVQTFFCLITPSVRAHLHLLSRLAHALCDVDFKALVKRQGSRQELLQEAKRVEEKVAAAKIAPKEEDQDG